MARLSENSFYKIIAAEEIEHNLSAVPILVSLQDVRKMSLAIIMVKQAIQK
jgi:hypothetical protein